MKTLTFPPNPASEGKNVSVETSSTIVIVGANGSGKSRLGSWFEFTSQEKDNVHRIGAQRSLVMPESTKPDSIERATNLFRYGWKEPSFPHKIGQRWSSKPTTGLLNDYEQLMNMLFAEDFEVSTKYRQAMRGEEKKPEVPSTNLDAICEIWNNILPHRNISFGSGKVEANLKKEGSPLYNGAEMSDGERVIFYLIGECLCVPPNSTIVIDEPEVHLHKTIQVKLFNEIEKARPDCLIVYITHDLEFASSRTNSLKICLNGFDGNLWDWYIVPDSEEIPEEIYLEVLGSRKSILFLEGEKGSLDTEIYSRVYPEMSIRPLASCTKVIEATKSFNGQMTLHHINSFGIIDRDYRSPEELTTLSKYSVYQPKVAEVENIFLIEPILKAVAKQLLLPNPDETVKAVTEWVVKDFEENLPTHITNTVFEIVDYGLNSLHKKGSSKDDVRKSLDSLFNKIDIDEIFNRVETDTKTLIDGSDYAGILRVINKKGLVKQVGRFFNVKPSYYIELAKHILDANQDSVLDAVASYLPDFKSNIIIKNS